VSGIQGTLSREASHIIVDVETAKPAQGQYKDPCNSNKYGQGGMDT